MEHLEQDMARFGLTLDKAEQAKLRAQLTPLRSRAGTILLNQTRVADRLLFLADGIAASQQTWSDGRTSIARFFESGDLCTNVSSAWTGELGSDDLIAITDLGGFYLPLAFFEAEYLYGGTLGTYLRYRMMEAHLFSKELACAKTANDTEVVYQFLRTHHRGVLDFAPKKAIAGFLGVTPQGFSRFLKRRQATARVGNQEIPKRPIRHVRASLIGGNPQSQSLREV